MIAVCIALAGIAAALTGFVITCGIWLRSDRRELSAITDNLDGQRKLVAEYKHKFDTELAKHTVTTKRLEQEQTLRAIAEAQRNEAQRKCRAYLTANLQGASNDEIAAVVSDLFAAGLSVVPSPEPRRSDSAGDYLLDPES